MDQSKDWIFHCFVYFRPKAFLFRIVARLCNLQIASLSLFSFDSLKECFEVAGSKSLMISPLDDLYEEGRPVTHGLTEDLKKESLLIEVNKDLILLYQLKAVLNLLHVDLALDSLL